VKPAKAFPTALTVPRLEGRELEQEAVIPCVETSLCELIPNIAERSWAVAEEPEAWTGVNQNSCV
jgi:hypothetical protein